jgi:hypothetical protein
VDFIVIVMRADIARIVVERIAAIDPAITRGGGECRLGDAADG